MPLYMVQFAYTPEALATMTKNPQDRSVPSQELIEKRGGRMIGFYFCFGEYDGVAIYEAPDDTTASAISMIAASPGHLKASHTTRLFTPEETMEAMRKATSITFQGPSQ
ncbi:MAG TPA: GYD domain-containing protein [Ktedonobacteraceae bacterium]|nr:GYD domain-containing protein [Ktedonobacteraceae bacterium]